jgi:hypothetical protein
MNAIKNIRNFPYRTAHHEGTKNTKLQEEKQKLDTGRMSLGHVSGQLMRRFTTAVTTAVTTAKGQ